MSLQMSYMPYLKYGPYIYNPNHRIDRKLRLARRRWNKTRSFQVIRYGVNFSSLAGQHEWRHQRHVGHSQRQTERDLLAPCACARGDDPGCSDFVDNYRECVGSNRLVEVQGSSEDVEFSYRKSFRQRLSPCTNCSAHVNRKRSPWPLGLWSDNVQCVAQCRRSVLHGLYLVSGRYCLRPLHSHLLSRLVSRPAEQKPSIRAVRYCCVGPIHSHMFPTSHWLGWQEVGVPYGEIQKELRPRQCHRTLPMRPLQWATLCHLLGDGLLHHPSRRSHHSLHKNIHRPSAASTPAAQERR